MGMLRPSCYWMPAHAFDLAHEDVETWDQGRSHEFSSWQHVATSPQTTGYTNGRSHPEVRKKPSRWPSWLLSGHPQGVIFLKFQWDQLWPQLITQPLTQPPFSIFSLNGRTTWPHHAPGELRSVIPVWVGGCVDLLTYTSERLWIESGPCLKISSRFDDWFSFPPSNLPFSGYPPFYDTHHGSLLRVGWSPQTKQEPRNIINTTTTLWPHHISTTGHLLVHGDPEGHLWSGFCLQYIFCSFV